MKTPESLQSWLLIPDAHVPFHDPSALDIILQILEAHRWDGILQIGDFLDLSCVSKFNGYSASKLQELPTLLEEYEAGRSVWRSILEAGRSQNEHCKFEWMEGNHEYRIRRFTDSMPQLGQICSIEHNFKDLFEDGLKWIPNWRGKNGGVPRKFGNDLIVIHGRRHSKYHARWMADDYSPYTVLYGHVHDVSSFTKQSFVAPGDVQCSMAQSIGYIALPQQEYVGHYPTNWQQGFATVSVLPGGRTFHEVYAIKGGVCVFRGKEYRTSRSSIGDRKLPEQVFRAQDVRAQADPRDFSGLIDSLVRYQAWGWE